MSSKYSLVSSKEAKLPSTQWRKNPSQFSIFRPNELFRRFIIILFLFFTISIIGLLITLLAQNSNVVSKLSEIDKKTNRCFQNVDKFSEQSQIWLGNVNGNQTTVISDDDSLQQFRINNNYESIGMPGMPIRGGITWVSKRNEIWIPYPYHNVIEIYETTTMNYIETIDTLQSGHFQPCEGPYVLSYNAFAGSGNHGQVWSSCAANYTGWTVFDPNTRKPIAFVPTPEAYIGYQSADLVVGKDFTVATLYLFSLPILPNLLQFSNNNFLPTGVTQSVGVVPITSHLDFLNNILYVSTFSDSKLYKLDFKTLEIIHIWTNFSQPWGVSSDASQNILYITENGANQIRIVSSSPPYNELSFSPISSIVENPSFLVRSYNQRLYVTSLSNQSYVAVFNINGNTQKPDYYSTLITSPGSFFITTSTINCLCELCN